MPRELFYNCIIYIVKRGPVLSTDEDARTCKIKAEEAQRWAVHCE